MSERLTYFRRRLYAPAPVIIWFLLAFCTLTFLGWPFSLIGFLSLFALYLWVAWGAPSCFVSCAAIPAKAGTSNPPRGDSPLLGRMAISAGMAWDDLTEKERALVLQLLREAVDEDRFRSSPRSDFMLLEAA